MSRLNFIEKFQAKLFPKLDYYKKTICLFSNYSNILTNCIVRYKEDKYNQRKGNRRLT